MQYENSLALRTSLETGWRISDVLALTPKQIQGRTLYIVAQKTGKADKKVVSADLAKRLKQISGKDFVFEGRFGDKPRTRQAVWKDLKRSAKQLKLDGNISCHSARKTYAVEDFKDGGLAKVQKDLQHSDVNTTMLYAFADLIDEMPAINGVNLTENARKQHHVNYKDFEKNPCNCLNNSEKITTISEKKAENDSKPFDSEIFRFGEFIANIVVNKIKEFLKNK